MAKGAGTNGTTGETLTLRGEEIPVTVRSIPVTELKFYSENPRLYSIVSAGAKEPGQEEIEEKLKGMEHVRQLAHSIRANGGLLEPVIVQDGTLVVLDGNSRLAAYRILAAKDPISWGAVKCTVLPKDIPESSIFALLGEYHIIGRKDWAPYEQAGYLYRRHGLHKISIQDLAADIGLKSKTVTQLIDVYKFMIKCGDNKVDRWSYYFEYLRSNKIKKVRNVDPRMDKVVVGMIKGGRVDRAADIRDKLPKVVDAGGKTLNRFLSGAKDLEDSYESAVSKGAGNLHYSRLNKFRKWLVDKNTEEDLLELKAEIRKKCEFELNQLRKRINNLLKKLDL
jgi:ParB/Sulfiredoxin domain